MTRLNNIPVTSKLRILSALFVTGMLIFGLLSYRTLNAVEIGSDTYHEISDSNAQYSDYSPPTQYLIQVRTLIYQMRVDIADKDKLNAEVAQFHDFAKAFEDGHQHWMATEEHQQIKDLMQKAYDPGHELLELTSNTYIPLLLAGKGDEADRFRIATMKAVFVEHQKRVDDFMTGMKAHLATHEAAAASMVNFGEITMIAAGSLSCGIIAFLTLVIGKGITGPLKQTEELLSEVSQGNLAKRLGVQGTDEIARMGKALNETIDNLSRALGQISSDAEVLFKASDAAGKVSRQLAENSQQTTTQAAAVSSAAEQVSQNVQTVSTAAEEMSSSIKEISKNASEAAEVAGSAARLASTTNATMTKLSESSAEIGNVIKVITSIAEQTNLLALNATIEAARAGEAGKGFAVVANEVKELAKETAKATEDIGGKIVAIQQDAKGAVDAINEITTVIGRINDIQNTIASAVEEQTGTTNEISRNVSETARGSTDIATNIGGVASSAKATQDCAAIAEASSAELSKVAVSLTGVVGQFKLSTNGRHANGAEAVR